MSRLWRLSAPKNLDAEVVPGGSGERVKKLQITAVLLDTIPRFWPNAE
jgi:hypothetical protein